MIHELCIFLLLNYLCIYSLHCAARGILALQPGVKPTPPAVEALSVNLWISKEIPTQFSMWLVETDTICCSVGALGTIICHPFRCLPSFTHPKLE